MGSLRDIVEILERYKETLPKGRDEQILHLDCGDGKITFEYLPAVLKKCKAILGIDSSDEMIRDARISHTNNSIYYQVRDITRDLDLEFLQYMWRWFHKVFCFTCNNWVKCPKKALENIKTLIYANAELFFAFVGSTPVYDTYEKLAKNPRWAKYMQDYRRYIPFTHYFKDPDAEFFTVVENAGYVVSYCEIMDKVIYQPTVETLNGHIRDVNSFVRGIPKAQKDDFIRECRENLSRKETKVLNYRIVILLAKNRRKVPKAIKYDYKLKEERPFTDCSSSSESSPEKSNKDGSTTQLSREANCTGLETSKSSLHSGASNKIGKLNAPNT